MEAKRIPAQGPLGARAGRSMGLAHVWGLDVPKYQRCDPWVGVKVEKLVPVVALRWRLLSVARVGRGLGGGRGGGREL